MMPPLDKNIPERRSGEDRRTIADEMNPSGAFNDQRQTIRRITERMIPELDMEVDRLAAEGRPREEIFRFFMERLGGLLAEAFAVNADEVAILLLADNGQMFRFGYPIKLYVGKMNVFPVGSQSIAAQVFRAKLGRVDNDATKVRHLSFYEQIRLSDRPASLIQKMMTAPIVTPTGKVIGVSQISRKGTSLEDSGAAFSQSDLIQLVDISRATAKRIESLTPADF
ncbi:MAG: hypothetical protein HZA20_10900 [Nitrospirae bacterium]|nr:hypothetical protein [Nitrospirota bacterium]